MIFSKKNLIVFILASLVVSVSCTPTNAEILIFDHNGIGPLDGEEKQTVIESGTYYSIHAIPSVFQKGEFYLSGEKTGTLSFDNDGKLIKQKTVTSHFGLPKEETIIEYEYSGGLLVHSTISLNGHIIQDRKMIYDNRNSVTMQSIFSAATRRDPQEGKTDSVRRGGGLKMDWTEPRGV